MDEFGSIHIHIYDHVNSEYPKGVGSGKELTPPERQVNPEIVDNISDMADANTAKEGRRGLLNATFGLGRFSKVSVGMMRRPGTGNAVPKCGEKKKAARRRRSSLSKFPKAHQRVNALV